MAAKKEVNFGAKPAAKAKVDGWVETREVSTKQSKAIPTTEVQPKIKRLTLDIPDDLHRKIKGKAVAEGVTMVEMLRELLEATYR
jgi:predicted DNA binding CopG/RHH family protein